MNFKSRNKTIHQVNLGEGSNLELFPSVDEDFLERPTVKTFRALLDNFEKVRGAEEKVVIT